MTHRLDALAKKLLASPYAELSTGARNVVRHVAERHSTAHGKMRTPEPAPTRGQRAADAVARFGGSWTFIGLFGAVLVSWVILNSLILVRYGKSFDPYPYILLNLVLSMLASIQAPIIMMSQNRHAEKDRQDAEHDYEVNLKAELEIMLLHEKIDALRQEQLGELLDLQKQQMALLDKLCVPPTGPA
jgi:uncharacterized membrane protein